MTIGGGTNTVMRLTDVNTTDIIGAIELARNAMCGVFDPNGDDVPYFRVVVRPVAYFGKPWESHVPGRHLNALLNAEDAAGLEVDEAYIEKFANACFYSYGGPVPFPLDRNDGEYDSPVVFNPHHIREGFHALNALVKYRASERAAEVAAASIAAVFEYWDPGAGWDYGRLEDEGVVSIRRTQSFISGVARAIGPLVKYYRTTGYPPALDLAIMLKEKCLDGYFTQDGSYAPSLFGTHAHSVTCTMSSLAQLADLTRDSTLMGLVKAFYDNGLWEMRDETGWSRETAVESGPNPDEGEMNNTGDILETALILGRWGYVGYFHDAERILRCHLLPSQLRDVSWIPAPDNPDGLDALRDVAQRTQGTWGFPAPFGHEPLEQRDGGSMRFNTDVVGGTVGSLCEALREMTRFDEAGQWVNLLFDHETPEVEVRSAYTHPALSVRIKKPGPLFVRVPPWCERDRMRITGAGEAPRSTNGYLFFANPPVNRPIVSQYDLPTEEITLHHATRDIRVRLRGDEVAAMENHGADLTFFDPL